MIQLGARLTLSDDSHGTHMVGLNYAKARDYLVSMGVQGLWHLTSSTEANAAGRFTIAVLDNEWQTHPFWSSEHPTA